MANFPTELIIGASQLETVDGSVNTTQAMNGISNTRTRNVQQWQFNIDLTREPKLNTWRPAVVDLCEFSQGLNPITIVHPMYTSILGSAAGVLTVNANQNPGDTSILVGGFGSNQVGVFLRGDIIRFSSSTKIYMITADTNAGALGEALLPIYPALRKSLVGLAATVIYLNVEFTMRHDDNFSIQFKSPSTAQVSSMQLVEHLD